MSRPTYTGPCLSNIVDEVINTITLTWSGSSTEPIPPVSPATGPVSSSSGSATIVLTRETDTPGSPGPGKFNFIRGQCCSTAKYGDLVVGRILGGVSEDEYPAYTNFASKPVAACSNVAANPLVFVLALVDPGDAPGQMMIYCNVLGVESGSGYIGMFECSPGYDPESNSAGDSLLFMDDQSDLLGSHAVTNTGSYWSSEWTVEFSE